MKEHEMKAGLSEERIRHTFEKENKHTSPKEDWHRLSGEHKVTFNGQPWKDVKPEFNSDEDVENFFRNTLLEKTEPSYTEEQKEKMIKHLMLRFNQTGYLLPMSNAADGAFLLEGGFGIMSGAGDDYFNEIEITSTEHGFILKQIYTVKKGTLCLYDDKMCGVKKPEGDAAYLCEAFTKDDKKNIGSLMPDEGKDYLFRIEGTIKIDFASADFSKDIVTPTVYLDVKPVSYGNALMESVFTQIEKNQNNQEEKLEENSLQESQLKPRRNFIEKIIYWFLTKLGLSVKISPPKNDITDQNIPKKEDDDSASPTLMCH